MSVVSTPVWEGNGYRFYGHDSKKMPECATDSIGLTVTSPPYWNAVDYDIHAQSQGTTWYRERRYAQCGHSYEEWLSRMQDIFKEVARVTIPGGFCCVVIGTLLYQSKHYPAPFDLLNQLLKLDWEFHQDIIWNKVTGGVKRAGSFIQRPYAGYYYPNIMTEYVLVLRKKGAPRRDTRSAFRIDEVFTRDIANNVWHIAPVPPGAIAHPCPFPYELAHRLIRLYSLPHDEVLDPFLGSGQTARAALKNQRKAVGYDIENHYLRLSAERIHEIDKRQFQLLPRYDKVLNTHAKSPSPKP